jgi:DNA-directed RNA polymerase
MTFYSTENIPAFFHTYQYVHGKRVGIIKFSEQLTHMLSREPIRDTLHPRLLPMLVHPKPWLSYNSGGYLSTKSVCMRIKDSAEQLVYLNKASENDHLANVLAGLDVLGSTCWRVNKNVFNVILEVWNKGEALADIPPVVNEHAPLPPKPENYDTDPKAKFNWVSEVKQVQTNERNNHSLRCDVNYKVETARAVSIGYVHLYSITSNISIM